MLLTVDDLLIDVRDERRKRRRRRVSAQRRLERQAIEQCLDSDAETELEFPESFEEVVPTVQETVAELLGPSTRVGSSVIRTGLYSVKPDQRLAVLQRISEESARTATDELAAIYAFYEPEETDFSEWLNAACQFSP